MASREHCDSCRYWQPTGLEDSGLLAADQSGKHWYYAIGDCTRPERAEALYKVRGLADWLPACEYWARQRGRRQGRKNLDD